MTLTARNEQIVLLPWKHIALGLIIRELLAPWTGHPYDFEIWVRLGYYMQNLVNPYGRLAFVPGLSFAPYATTGSISYPPFSAFIFAITFRLYALFGEPSRFLYYFMLKQPMVFADVGAAVVLARIILLSGNPGSARRAFLVWIYFPLGIIISSVWGQLDPISLFLSLLAVYYSLNGRWGNSAVMLGLSIYLKTLPLVFLPIFLMHIRTGRKVRLKYGLVSLGVPALGTLAPALALNWGFQGMYDNFSFHVAIPVSGAMSALGLVFLVLSPPSPARYVIGALWVPVLASAYVYIWKRDLGLVQGLIFAGLTFSISRPYLPEQWTIYPLAFLLLLPTWGNMRHFVGMAVASTTFLIANNTLLVRFLAPISLNALNWDIFINNLSTYVGFRIVLLALLTLLYFAESFLVVLGRESIVYRMIVSARPLWSFREQHVFPVEVGID